MSITNLCRCGHQKIVHRWSDNPGPHYCTGKSHETCDCTNYRPRPEPQETK